MAKSVLVSKKHVQVDSFNEDSRSCEYTVSQKAEGKWKLARILLVIGYVVFAVGYFTLCMVLNIWPVACLTPVLVWIAVYFTWRYVSVAYRYRIISGEWIFTRILSDRFKKKMFTLKIHDMIHIAPVSIAVEKSRAEAFGAEKVLWAASSMSSPDLYYAIFEDENKVKCILYFEATQKALRLLNFYNKSVVLTKVRY